MIQIENNSDFTDAKKGDKVWSIEYGWGEIFVKDMSYGGNMTVVFDHSTTWHYYTQKGVSLSTRSIDVAMPTLFKKEIKIIQKKMIRTKIEGYANIYRDGKGNLYTGALNSDKDIAIKRVETNALAKGVKFISEEFEIEENGK